jgi:hypothetical protein
MTCREVDEALIIAPGRELSSQARAHLVTCESCRRLASAIEAEGSRYKLPIDLRKRIQASVPSSIAPVRPLAPNAFWVTAFLLIFAGIGMGAAGGLGIHGWPALSLAGRILIFPVLVALAVLAAFAAVRQMRPGSRSIGSGILLATIFLAMETVFFLTFHDYSLGNFVRSGYRCLSLGLFTAIPAGGLVWLLFRRGYILAPISVGCLVGLLGGLTGLFTLELHCPILTIPHVAIWHTGVLAISSAFGAACGWVGSRIQSR